MKQADIVGILRSALEKERRPPDGKLHPSGDLIGSLRHSMLRAAGAPTIESKLVQDVRLRTGTMWHDYLHDILRKAGVFVMPEIKLDQWLPEGWSGTADWLFWLHDQRAFRLRDVKSCKGEALKWIEKDGVKEEHLWQLSAYYHALVDSKMPMVKKVDVFYLPMNDTTDPEEAIEPLLVECDPLPKATVWPVMEQRWAITQDYLDTLWVGEEQFPGEPPNYLQHNLAEPQARVQKMFWNKDHWDVKLVPHWSAQFCPYPNELCDCSEQGTTKIGEWKFLEPVEDLSFVEWHPRAGYDISPDARPDIQEVRKRLKSLKV